MQPSLNGIQEVASSILVSSTTEITPFPLVAAGKSSPDLTFSYFSIRSTRCLVKISRVKRTYR